VQNISSLLFIILRLYCRTKSRVNSVLNSNMPIPVTIFCLGMIACIRRSDVHFNTCICLSSHTTHAARNTVVPYLLACLLSQVTFDANNTLTVATDDRLGLYGASSSFGERKLNVPYVVDDASGSSSSLQLSRQRFNDSSAPFVAGQLQITVQDLRWPRTFAPYLTFCTTSGTTRRLLVSIRQQNAMCFYY